MMRLVLLVLLIAAVALAFASVMTALRSVNGTRPRPETPMPKPFRLISFVLLFLLMLGVSTGWLGAA
ncbi:hypothetical protein [Loktanella sp. SALINAS62]|uniref:hypothetical protein n=1 Tax=Loktanella sp. SALINAS62 TaxID=2706124 RepID=UPI001B8D1BCB|nr:hypothetical protein [Loktanella sp. SALINAS62]MBS1303178.1 hypothetical protein [Loktanella sp. SALINAS62]